MNYKEIIHQIKSLHDPEAVKGMARFGINPKNTYGVSVPHLRNMAKQIWDVIGDVANLTNILCAPSF